MTRQELFLFPVRWARSAQGSFLVTSEQARDALHRAGFGLGEWRDDTALAIEWMNELASTTPVTGQPSLGAVIGLEFPSMIRNLGRNLVEGRVGMLSAVARGHADGSDLHPASPRSAASLS